MCELRLHFTTRRGTPRLHKIESHFGGIYRCSVGGEFGGTPPAIGKFRWSRGVRALSILVLRSLVASFDSSIEPMLIGGRGSIAASLDSVLSKEPSWLLDTFGVFPNGTPVHRRFFARSNPGRKRLGPVAVSLARRVEIGSVTVLCDGTRRSTPAELCALLRQLEREELIPADSCPES